MPGNTSNLQKATAARTAAAAGRAENALVAMIKEGEPVTLRGLAAKAAVPLDLLYRNAGIRARIEHHRASRPARPEPAAEHASSVVRTLTAQLADLKRRHREETAALRQALEIPLTPASAAAIRRALAALDAVPAQRRELGLREHQLISDARTARTAGATWGQIAARLGKDRQATQQRHQALARALAPSP